MPRTRARLINEMEGVSSARHIGSRAAQDELVGQRGEDDAANISALPVGGHRFGKKDVVHENQTVVCWVGRVVG